MKTTILNEEHNLPLVVEPEEPMGSADLRAWYAEHRDWVTEKLHHHGALLFRGFGVDSQEEFGLFSDVANEDPLEYVDGNSPRTQLGGGIYTSTEYPKEYFISMHNELSYSKVWPARIYFCCIVPPAEGMGGETPLANSRRLLDKIDPRITYEFRRRKVKYIRNLHSGRGFGPSWQKTFQMEKPEELESYAAANDMNLEWRDNGYVSLSAVRPAIVEHPHTGEEVWFNQADQFHPTTHPPDVFESMMKLYQGQPDRIPQTATFGDDTEIDPAMFASIRATTKENLVLCRWQKGDVVVADNTLTAHGRMPFEGERRILVSMSGH